MRRCRDLKRACEANGKQRERVECFGGVLTRFCLFDSLLLLEEDSLVGVNEPLHGLSASNTLVLSDSGDGSSAVLDASASTSEDDVDVHTEDTNGRIVLDTKIDVLLDTKAEVSSVREVALEQLVLLNLQGLLEDLSRLRTAHSRVDGDLFVTTDTEGTDGVAGLRVDGGLSSQLVEHCFIISIPYTHPSNQHRTNIEPRQVTTTEIANEKEHALVSLHSTSSRPSITLNTP